MSWDDEEEERRRREEEEEDHEDPLSLETVQTSPDA